MAYTPIWQVAGTSTYQVKAATVRDRLLTGNVNLQVHRDRFKQHPVDATCPLCKQDNETVVHHLVLCPELKSHRNSFTSRLTKLYSGSSRLSLPYEWSEWCQFILNGPPHQVTHTHMHTYLQSKPTTFVWKRWRLVGYVVYTV